MSLRERKNWISTGTVGVCNGGESVVLCSQGELIGQTAHWVERRGPRNG